MEAEHDLNAIVGQIEAVSDLAASQGNTPLQNQLIAASNDIQYLELDNPEYAKFNADVIDADLERITKSSQETDIAQDPALQEVQEILQGMAEQQREAMAIEIALSEIAPELSPAVDSNVPPVENLDLSGTEQGVESLGIAHEAMERDDVPELPSPDKGIEHARG